MLDEQKTKSLKKELIDFLNEPSFKKLSEESMEILGTIYAEHKCNYMDKLTEHKIPGASNMIQFGYTMFLPLIFLIARETKDISFILKKPKEDIIKLFQVVFSQSFHAMLNSLEIVTKQ